MITGYNILSMDTNIHFISILTAFSIHYEAIIIIDADFEVFGKLTRACKFQIALETILLPILIVIIKSLIGT
jgi:hypothetical protein